VLYPKNGSLTPVEHVCSGNGFFSSYYGKCLCNPGWETSGGTTAAGPFGCNIKSTDASHSFPWVGEVLMAEQTSCDCSMRWTHYEGKTIEYDGGTEYALRMWGVSSEILNGTSDTNAHRMAKQMCYLHFDCDAVTVTREDPTTDLFVVKYWTHNGAGDKTEMMTSGVAPETQTFIIERFAYSDCVDSKTVDADHLYDETHLTDFHSTSSTNPGAMRNWVHERWYEYFHRHPEFVTPNSDCERGQPRTGASCEVALCPPMRRFENASHVDEPCAGNGFCEEVTQRILATAALSKTTCDCGAKYFFELFPGSTIEVYCQASNAEHCIETTAGCTSSTCCSGRGKCYAEVAAGEDSPHVFCKCDPGAMFDGPYCDTPKCNPTLGAASCVSTGQGDCQGYTDEDGVAKHRCLCYNPYYSTGRVWNATAGEAVEVDEDDENCDGDLNTAAHRRLMCYDDTVSASRECGGRGLCTKVNCTEFGQDGCNTFPQACRWDFVLESCVSYWPVASEVYSCACFDDHLTGNPSFTHGMSISDDNEPKHCSVSRCTTCEPGQGRCSHNSENEVTGSGCDCFKDTRDYEMFEGGRCETALYNDSNCTPVYSHAVDPPTLTCTSCSGDYFGPYCNLTCPTPSSDVTCDARNCGVLRTSSCLSSSSAPPIVNATDCVCPCFSNELNENHAIEENGYCTNPCVTGVYRAVSPGVFGCACVEPGSSGSCTLNEPGAVTWVGQCNGYSGERCEISKCANGGGYEAATDTCDCVDGWTGSTCETCSSNHYLASNGTACLPCPACQNGGTCVREGSGELGGCSCPPAFIGNLCEMSACVNTTGGDCNGTWAVGCVRYDSDANSPVCECQVWSQGTVHFGESYYDDCTISLNDTLCNGRGFTEGIPPGATAYQCTCDEGFKGSDCGKYEDDNGCTGNFVFDEDTGECVCSFEWSGPNCTVPCSTEYCNGAVDICLNEPFTFANGSTDPVTCVCSSYVTEGVQQCAKSYRDAVCSGHGQKPITGSSFPMCDCDEGFLQPDCSSMCRTGKCNNHGSCEEGDQGTTTNCTCDTDWTGAFCTVHQCSDNGLIVGAEQSCLCNTGWVGTTCCEHETNCNGRADVIVVDGACVCDCPDGLEQPHCTNPSAGESATEHDVANRLDPGTPSGYVHHSHLPWIITGAVGGTALVIVVIIVSVYHFRRVNRAKKSVKDSGRVKKNTPRRTRKAAKPSQAGTGGSLSRRVHRLWA
jgi:hypothetical protein